MLNYFIIKLFNIEGVELLDEDKSEAHISGVVKNIDLYLVRHLYVCPECGSDSIYSKGTKKEIIKHVLNGGEACNIIFHKRRYKSRGKYKK